MDYEEYHGSPKDRGSADAYYSRPYNPHYWPEGSYKGDMIPLKDMSAEEIAAYTNGFTTTTDRKNWYWKNTLIYVVE